MEGAARSTRQTRSDSRRDAVLEAAAELFARKGFDGVSMRDIARRAGMLSGSLYYHFASKEELFAEVHGRAIERIHERLDAALEGVTDPWRRLEAAIAAHLEALVGPADSFGVLTPDFPADRVDLSRALVAQRDAYEARLRTLVAEAGLREDVDPGLFRLFLLGAMNWTPVWFRAGRGAELPEVARALSDLLRRGAAAD